jgi:hypothetical protein
MLDLLRLYLRNWPASRAQVRANDKVDLENLRPAVKTLSNDSTTQLLGPWCLEHSRRFRQVSSIRFDRDDLKRWNDALESIIAALEAAKFNPNLLYVLYLTLDRLTDDQWARVDKRLFYGEGVHTREGVNNSRDKWQLWPDARKWQRWLELVTEGKILPHEATERFLLSPVFADCPSRVGHNEAWSW